MPELCLKSGADDKVIYKLLTSRGYYLNLRKKADMRAAHFAAANVPLRDNCPLALLGEGVKRSKFFDRVRRNGDGAGDGEQSDFAGSEFFQHIGGGVGGGSSGEDVVDKDNVFILERVDFLRDEDILQSFVAFFAGTGGLFGA